MAGLSLSQKKHVHEEFPDIQVKVFHRKVNPHNSHGSTELLSGIFTNRQTDKQKISETLPQLGFLVLRENFVQASFCKCTILKTK